MITGDMLNMSHYSGAAAIGHPDTMTATDRSHGMSDASVGIRRQPRAIEPVPVPGMTGVVVR
jgi:hypothetical protein